MLAIRTGIVPTVRRAHSPPGSQLSLIRQCMTPRRTRKSLSPVNCARLCQFRSLASVWGPTNGHMTWPMQGIWFRRPAVPYLTASSRPTGMALVCSCATTQLVLRGTGSLSLVGGAGRPPGERAAEMPVATTAPAGVQGPGRPGLPGELVSRILSKVDPLDSATLAAAAAVCRAWRPWATERLYAYCRPPLSKLDSLAAFWESQYPSGDDAPSASLLLDAPRLQHAVRLDGLFPLPPRPPALHRLALHSPPASALVTAKDYRHMAGGSLAALLTRSPRLLRLVLPESYGEDRLSIDDFFLSCSPPPSPSSPIWPCTTTAT
ncbi:hypothetical protein DFJ74DRAFT_775778 [Hyaloraphidium curvatum]|nr:hypothetical protein DFJ74DRAFT_775778 [Hyaloraphidium curvatum]